MNFKEIKELKDRIMAGGEISREEAVGLSKTGKIDALFYSANQLRARFCGNRVEMCANFNVVEGNCPEDCNWCPLSSITTINYGAFNEFQVDKAIEKANEIHKKGVHHIEISTNRNTLSESELDKFINLINNINGQTEIELCASLGMLTYEQLLRIKNETKVRRYHCNIETSENFYPKVCSTINYQSKLETLRNAGKAGFELCSGGIIGMGESMEDRIDMAITLRELGVRSISLNILFAFNGTPFEKHQPINSQEILTTFALFRFINPKARIRFARGRSSIKIIEKEAIQSGINASLAGDLLVDAQNTDIDNDIRLFENEGFRI